MTQRERLEAAFALEKPDRTPILGGWIAAPGHIADLAGVTLEAYWADPLDVSIRAYQILGSDGLIDVFVPKSCDDYRCVDRENYLHAQTSFSLEEAIARIDAMPTPESVEEDFDFESEYDQYRAVQTERQTRCGDMVWMPAQWGGSPTITWYGEFGYENFFLIVGMYPDRARKLLEIGGAQARCRCRIIARLVREGLYPHSVLLGEDICTQRGPMISIRFMEKYYAPQVRYALEPLLEVGCRPVWHCDGDVRQMLDFLVDSGVQGLQGFQPECGMILEELVQRRTREGEPLLLFGPLSVTTELPQCQPVEIIAKVQHAIEVCRGNASLVLFTANTINPDVPLENILAMHEAVQA